MTRQLPNQPTAGDIDTDKMVLTYQRGGGDIDAATVDELVALASGLDQSAVDSRINTVIPANRRLPDPGSATDGEVATAQNDGTVEWETVDPFDIHDDVTTAATIADADRIPFSDEGASGDPMRYSRADAIRTYMQQGIQAGGLSESEVDSRITTLRPNPFTDDDESKLDGIAPSADVNVGVEFTSTLRTKLNSVESNAKDDQTGPEIVTAIDANLGNSDWQTGGDSFDIHDDVTTPATINNDDRIAFSDEGSSGDPMRYARAASVRMYMHQGLGSASAEDVGTGVGNVAQIGPDGMLPTSILPESTAPGSSGASSIFAFRRSATEPSAPIASDFTAANSLITTYASGWGEDFPAGDEILWAVNLRVTGSTVVVSSVGRLTGDTGDDGDDGTNANDLWSSISNASLPSTWTPFQWYATGYTPDTDADYLVIEGRESSSVSHSVHRISISRFTSLFTDSAGNPVNTIDRPWAIPLSGIHEHYTAYITRTTSNEVLVAISDSDAGFSGLSFRTYTINTTVQQQQAIAAGSNRVNHVFFRRSATKPADPSVIYLGSSGYSPAITSSSDWQLKDPDKTSSDSLWVAYSQSTYNSSSDAWTQISWTVILASDGFEVEYSHSTSGTDITWHDPPLHDADHTTPDNYMRFRIPGSGNWSPAILIRDRDSDLTWTPIFNDFYPAKSNINQIADLTFTEIQLSEFNEMLMVATIFDNWVSGQPNSIRGVVSHIFTNAQCGGEWQLAPRDAEDEYNSDYTWRCEAHRRKGMAVVFNNPDNPNGDSDQIQATFHFQLVRSNTSTATGQDTVANKVVGFNFGIPYNRLLVDLYGR